MIHSPLHAVDPLLNSHNYQPRHGRSPPRAGLFLPLASVSFGGLTPSSHDRLFGTDAANLASRFPTDSFQATKLLLGIPCDGASVTPSIDRASVLHGTNVVPAPNNRAACAYQRGNANNTVNSVEELVGMQLATPAAAAVAGAAPSP
ncbi:hypothetical protein A4X06_0g9332 [Tilletia controversa]|uniref:Uncharacterized protein n=1 Tax=Tilletia controversa TaxID=13291 RepID=A0A8X7SSC0_9BASI|nr:hypothetical protein CF336_g9044 [Tilletia laevis]KAE8237122.1 hypothetical protein A4X06_0g9332 [Tilletia controversa]